LSQQQSTWSEEEVSMILLQTIERRDNAQNSNEFSFLSPSITAPTNSTVSRKKETFLFLIYFSLYFYVKISGQIMDKSLHIVLNSSDSILLSPSAFEFLSAYESITQESHSIINSKI
jgi:hypothetical protein